MYPYCSNTSIKNTTINTRETNNVIDLKQDQRLLQLLEIAQQETQQSLSAFDALMQNKALQQDVEMLRNAYLDEVKHLKLLQEIWYNITGKSQSQPQPKSTKTNSEAVRTEIEKTLLQEMEQTDFFRELGVVNSWFPQ